MKSAVRPLVPCRAETDLVLKIYEDVLRFKDFSYLLYLKKIISENPIKGRIRYIYVKATIAMFNGGKISKHTAYSGIRYVHLTTFR